MEQRVFIHATNVHQGGGRFLLEALLGGICHRTEFVLSLDERMPIPRGLDGTTKVARIRPSVVQRLRAEKRLARDVGLEDIVLCFGNLPPLFKLRCHVVVFVQNRYLVDNVDLGGFPPKTRLRLWVERLWVSSRLANVNEFVVQTPEMKRLLEVRTKGLVPVRVLPFMLTNEGYTRKAQQPKCKKKSLFDFIYVASGEPHKNHRRLIEAWILLAEQGVYPSLILTLDETESSELCIWLHEMAVRHRLKIQNLGRLPREQVQTMYKQAGALIYPSTFESFGLPLIEARQSGLPILASELNYVRDVIDPEETFDPSSDVSIARAVKRFMGLSEFALPLLDAAEFLKQILERTEQNELTDR